MYKFVFIFLFLEMFAKPAFSQKPYDIKIGAGNGIFGTNNCVELYDFYEFGVSSEISILPYNPINDSSRYLDKLKDSNKGQIGSIFNETVLMLIASKLIEVKNINPTFASHLLNIIINNRYRISNPEEFHLLNRGERLGASPIDYSWLPLTSIAIRDQLKKGDFPWQPFPYYFRTSSISFHKDLLKKMCSNNHIVGLIFHIALTDYVWNTSRSNWFMEELAISRQGFVDKYLPQINLTKYDRGSGSADYLRLDLDSEFVKAARRHTTEARILTAKLFSKYFLSMSKNDLTEYMLMLGLEIYETSFAELQTTREKNSQAKFYFSWLDEKPTFRRFWEQYTSKNEPHFPYDHERSLSEMNFRNY